MMSRSALLGLAVALFASAQTISAQLPTPGATLYQGCPPPAELNITNPIGNCVNQCTEDSTYYLNLPNNLFPAQSLQLGSQVYNVDQLKAILQAGRPELATVDQSLALAYSLIPVLENLAAGTSTANSDILRQIAIAQAFLTTYPPYDFPANAVYNCTQKTMEENAIYLFQYNCGNLAGSPGACAGVTCTEPHPTPIIPGYQTGVCPTTAPPTTRPATTAPSTGPIVIGTTAPATTKPATTAATTPATTAATTKPATTAATTPATTAATTKPATTAATTPATTAATTKPATTAATTPATSKPATFAPTTAATTAPSTAPLVISTTKPATTAAATTKPATVAPTTAPSTMPSTAPYVVPSTAAATTAPATQCPGIAACGLAPCGNGIYYTVGGAYTCQAGNLVPTSAQTTAPAQAGFSSNGTATCPGALFNAPAGPTNYLTNQLVNGTNTVPSGAYISSNGTASAAPAFAGLQTNCNGVALQCPVQYDAPQSHGAGVQDNICYVYDPFRAEAPWAGSNLAYPSVLQPS